MSDQPKDGGPAFHQLEGLTTRDYFAGQALAGLLANHGAAEAIGRVAKKAKIDPDQATAVAAFGYADALLAERDKTDE